MIRILLVLLSAGLYALAFPPWNQTWLAPIALIPFLRAIRGVALWRSALLGTLWGTVMIHAIGHWVPVAIAVYWEQPLWFGFAFSISAGIAFIGAYSAGFAVCATWVSARATGWPRVTMLALLWVAWELARARVLTGDPWLLIGYALAPYPSLIQIADLGGVYLVSFLLIFVNSAIAEVIPPVRRGEHKGGSAPIPPVRRGEHKGGSVPIPPVRRGEDKGGSVPIPPVRRGEDKGGLLIATAAMIAVTLGYSRYRLDQPLPNSPSIPIAIIQGNNNLGSQWKQEHYGQGLETYLQLSAAAARQRPAVLIWPESAVTFFLAREPGYRRAIAELLARSGADLIVGGPHMEDADPARPQYFNSAFYMTAAGEVTQRYDKVHLMPFGEYFPLRTIELLRRRFERVRYFTPGDDLRLLDTRLGKAAVVICFEAMFPELVRARMNAGAAVLLNLSNDAWLGDDAGPKQHASMTVFRAIENRTWVVRATTTGVSMIIDPHGRVREQAPLLTPAVVHAAVVPLRLETFYKRFGDLFAYACIVLAAIGSLLIATRTGPRDAAEERAAS